MEEVGIFCGHLVNFMVIWDIFPRFGMLYQEKSGNPDVKVTLYLHRCRKYVFCKA
jgi:hypothetical protein